MLKSNWQHLLLQDGKLYGRDPIFAVICKAAALPEVAKNHDIQKNESVIHLGQVRNHDVFLGGFAYFNLSFSKLYFLFVPRNLLNFVHF